MPQIQLVNEQLDIWNAGDQNSLDFRARIRRQARSLSRVSGNVDVSILSPAGATIETIAHCASEECD